MFALCDEKPNKGTLRETFFNMHLAAKHKVYVSKTSDFLVDKKYTFEIGGKIKGKEQITDIPHSFVIKDTKEFGFDHQIPLWIIVTPKFRTAS